MYNDYSKIINVDIEKEMRDSFLAYSMSVIVARALPDVRDGLKPVHRRILYTMYENGLTPDKAFRKCADTVGTVLGRYHPHGDASVYDAMVRLAQPFSMRYPLITGHGNFGSPDGDPPAAYRYTESRLSKMSLDMLTDLNKETVDFGMNYDDRLKEPTVLPSRFPNLLVNGSIGIAVGMATNIPPHNLTEVIDGIRLVMDNPETSDFALMEVIKGPDFPGGGVIMGRAGIRAAYLTGRGKITVRSPYHIEESGQKRSLVFDEVPYMVHKNDIEKHIDELRKDKRIEGITLARDESDKDEAVRFVVQLSRDANVDIVVKKLYSLTDLQSSFSINTLALVDGVPKTLTLRQMIDEYIKFQIEVIRRRTEFDLKKAKERAHILEGLAIATDGNNIDEVVEICKTSKDRNDAISRLCERFPLSEIQADAIVQLRLLQLTGLERQKIIDELEALHAKIKEFEAILADNKLVMEIIGNELDEIKRKFGDERRTKIEDVSGEVDIEDLIPDEECVLTFTDIGYIKRQPLAAYKSQHRGGRGVNGMKQRDEDFVSEMITAGIKDNIVFITNRGIMYRVKCYELPEGGRTSKGTNIINILPLSENEKVTAIIPIKAFEPGLFLTMVTKKGKLKRTSLESYRNARRSGLIALNLAEDDEIAGVKLTDGDMELIISTKNGYSLRFHESKVRAQGRQASGVRGITLRNETDEVVDVVRVHENAYLLTITDRGFGRKTPLDAFPMKVGRGGKGVLNYRVDDERGYVIGAKVLRDDKDILLINSDGVIIRILAESLRPMGRGAKGVRMMKLSDDARIITFAPADHEEGIETAVVEDVGDDGGVVTEDE
ncbi:MAG: DNA gyrase subunit A [Ruminococcus sp.]|jgi:DNA gyrase subunit A|nr:DNA gyrase subunit A [Ruminococcus sp.]